RVHAADDERPRSLLAGHRHDRGSRPRRGLLLAREWRRLLRGDDGLHDPRPLRLADDADGPRCRRADHRLVGHRGVLKRSATSRPIKQAITDSKYQVDTTTIPTITAMAPT